MKCAGDGTAIRRSILLRISDNETFATIFGKRLAFYSFFFYEWLSYTIKNKLIEQNGTERKSRTKFLYLRLYDAPMKSSSMDRIWLILEHLASLCIRAYNSNLSRVQFISNPWISMRSFSHHLQSFSISTRIPISVMYLNRLQLISTKYIREEIISSILIQCRHTIYTRIPEIPTCILWE